MEKALSSLRLLLLWPFFSGLLLISGCAQQKAFDFSGPVAQVKPASKIESRDSAPTVATSLEATIPAISQETYPLVASIAQPFPAKFPPRHTPASVVSTPAKGLSKSNKMAKRTRKALVQNPNPSSLPLPAESKISLVFAVIALITLGVVIIPGFTLSTYVASILIGLIAFIFAFMFGLSGKSKGAKQPEKYNERGAKRIGVFSWVLAALLGAILLALLII